MAIEAWHVRRGDYVLDGEIVGRYRDGAGEAHDMRAAGWSGRVRKRASRKRAIPEGGLVIEADPLVEVEIKAPESLTILEGPHVGDRVSRHEPILIYYSDDEGREVSVRSKLDGIVTWRHRSDEHGQTSHLYTVATVEPGKQRQALEADYCRGLRRSVAAFRKAVEEAEAEADDLKLAARHAPSFIHGGAKLRAEALDQIANLRERAAATWRVEARERHRILWPKAPASIPAAHWDVDLHERIVEEVTQGLRDLRTRRDNVVKRLRRIARLGPGPGGRRRWDQQSALESLASFRELHERWPKARDLGPKSGTPSARWLIAEFSSLAAAIDAAERLVD